MSWSGSRFQVVAADSRSTLAEVFLPRAWRRDNAGVRVFHYHLVTSEVRAVEASPPPLRHVEELVGHQQSFRPRACSLRHPLAQPHGRERRLDHVARAEMLPVFGGKVEEGQEYVSVLLQRRDGLRVLGAVLAGKTA